VGKKGEKGGRKKGKGALKPGGKKGGKKGGRKGGGAMKPEGEKPRGGEKGAIGGTVNGRDIRHGAHTENAKKGVYWI
jgi:hypothetical protein